MEFYVSVKCWGSEETTREEVISGRVELLGRPCPASGHRTNRSLIDFGTRMSWKRLWVRKNRTGPAYNMLRASV